jgi:hypothetical protein
LPALREFPYALPSGNEITFREPYAKDRNAVIGMLKPDDRQSVEELLAAYCLKSINGNPFREPDPRHRMGSWTIKDQQAYTRLFLEMFTIGEGDVADIKEVAKKLLSGASSSSESTSESQSEHS